MRGQVPQINTAIQNFCRMPTIMVPSAYAKYGRKVGNAHVAISGTCNPPQYVPPEWCRYQFAKLCAHGNAQGLGNVRYGRNGCQAWHIDHRYGFKRDAEPEAEALASLDDEVLPEDVSEPDEV